MLLDAEDNEKDIKATATMKRRVNKSRFLVSPRLLLNFSLAGGFRTGNLFIGFGHGDYLVFLQGSRMVFSNRTLDFNWNFKDLVLEFSIGYWTNGKQK